jgi:DNA-binding PadR family transcriptional regulator
MRDEWNPTGFALQVLRVLEELGDGAYAGAVTARLSEEKAVARSLVYQAINRLKWNGFIETSEEVRVRGASRKIFRLTEKGAKTLGKSQ